MNAEKEILLNNTYKLFMDKGLGQIDSICLDEITDKAFMGFGSAVDEKIFSLDAFQELLRRQKEQSKYLSLSWNLNEVMRYISPDENTAVFADDIYLTIASVSEKNEMYLRFTIVLIYKNEKWLVVHFHGSKPENVDSEKDTFGIEGWRQKNVELEALVKKRTAELEQSLLEIKSTQSQLIQSEKLASLGQLAAGIAHEIKNPMNFINNFSELSLEYVEEIRQELAKLDTNETTEEIASLLDDVAENLKKVHHHGTRADNIVKSMLMHSRGGSGIMEPTDLNELIKEYVNLAFHGMRAGKTAINVKIELDLEASLPLVELNAEDFSRVILNLCKNAFDAMRTKGLQPENQDYKPVLKVSTKNLGDGFAAINIEDNGPGVPDAIKDKLFQPFFTTKKGTEGTGLGLSITHDIIIKHNGTITIASTENTFTRFEIQLPITTKKIK